MENPKIIAYLGKGGSGKSIISALTAKIAIERGHKVLLIDADPALGLVTALDIRDYKTIGMAREEIIKQAKIASKQEEKEHLSDIMDYLLLETLNEGSDFSMLAMGQTNTIGCYCPVNTLLRSAIRSISNNYDVVIIDAEAGFEQINRQVTESVQYPILLTDNSKRGVATTILAKNAMNAAPRMKPVKLGVIFNRVDTISEQLKSEILEEGLLFYGTIPVDPVITEQDMNGINSLETPADSKSLKSLKEILVLQEIIN